MGCHKLAIIADRMYEKIVGLKMIRIVGPLLVEKSDGVKHAAVGALKNLSLASEDVCQEMVDQVRTRSPHMTPE